ncbi:MAG: aminoacyl-tRNA hydrolase [Holophagales bacterium]|nr:aminoacyl-tRNA hydrolase [Holophagales bacterium]
MTPDSRSSPPADTDSADVAPRYRVLVGLGNPGEAYAATRHNVGFRVVEELARRWRVEKMGEECSSRVAEAGDRLLAMPLTYMNRSGFAVRCLLERRELRPEDFLVIYDEVHLPLGTLRLRPKGSPAGHRGLESVLENLGTDRVPRLRLGVGAADAGPAGGDELVGFVLGEFEADELPSVAAMVARAADACETWLDEGTDVAMQRFNGPTPAGDVAE